MSESVPFYGGLYQMPIYEYECGQCGRIKEVIQKFSDKPLTQCDHCSGRLHKLVSHTSFHLKGTGWYATDYAGKSRASTANGPAKNKADKPAGNGSTGTDTQPKSSDK
ncbi:MAG: FmdB family zinc ribbon protein [Desulfobacterales bacterium]